jgi:hypothetical protein
LQINVSIVENKENIWIQVTSSQPQVKDHGKRERKSPKKKY